MMYYHTRRRHAPPAAVPKRHRPRLESLEERGSPSVLLPDGFAQTPLQAPAMLSPGWVSDAEFAGVTAARAGDWGAVLHAGAGSEHGPRSPTSDPTPVRFTSFQAGGLFQTELGGGPSTMNTEEPASEAPVIRGFCASEGADGWWTFAGRVEGDSPGGLLVYFGGLESLEGQAVEVDEDGRFRFMIQLRACEEGLATAQAVGWGGQASDVAVDFVYQTNCRVQ